MKTLHLIPCFAVLSLLGICSLAQATPFSAFIVKPVATPVFESEYNPDGRFAIDSANGVGLAVDLVTGSPVPVVYPLHNSNHQDQWLTLVPDSVTFIVYDLGAEYKLTGLHLWNYNEGGGGGRGIRNTELSFSSTSPIAGFSGSENFVFGPASGLSHAGVDAVFSQEIFARYVRFDITTNNGGNHTGIAEVRFLAVPVPEPSTCVLLGLGIVGMAIQVRRQRRAAA